MLDNLTDYKFTLMGDKICVQSRETNQFIKVIDFPDRETFTKMLSFKKQAYIDRSWHALQCLKTHANMSSVARIINSPRANIQQIEDYFFYRFERWCYSKDILSRIS